MWTFTIGTQAGVSNSVIDQTLAVVQDAANYWGRYIDFGSAVLDIRINFISLGDTTLAQAGTSFTSVGANLFQADTILEVQTGNDQNGIASDIDIDINIDTINDNDFYYGTLADGGPVSGLIDLFTVILHEIGHGLGYLSFSDEPENAVYDTFVSGPESNAVFTGSAAVAAFGGTVALSNNDLSHLGSNIFVLAPAIPSGQRKFLHEVEVRILQDVGLPIKNPTSGADSLFGFAQADDISLLGGDDIIFADTGNDNIDGGDGNDTIFGEGGNDTLRGRNDKDKLDGGDGDDLLLGASGDDNLKGRDGADDLRGGDGDDRLNGHNGADLLDGEAQNDTLKGGNGDDTVFGGDGDDAVKGSSDNDSVRGNKDNDTVWGGGGDDELFGNGQNDNLKGQSGNDTLNGGNHNDTLDGGSGNDTFIFERGSSVDVIRDFDAGPGVTDQINLVGFGADFDSLQEIIDASSESNGNLVIDFGGGDKLRLKDTTIDDLDADDFIFS